MRVAQLSGTVRTNGSRGSLGFRGSGSPPTEATGRPDVEADGRFFVELPPGRYVATWTGLAGVEQGLGELCEFQRAVTGK